MKTVLVKHTISKDRFRTMSDDDILSIIRLYSGRLDRIEYDDKCVVLYIIAPSTWRYCLLNTVLLPYRFI